MARHRRPASAPVAAPQGKTAVTQLLISRDAWRTQTSGSLFRPRRNVDAIDDPLHTYNTTPNLPNLNALITALRTYISGKEYSDPTNARLARARTLLGNALTDRGNLLRPNYDAAHVGHALAGADYTSLSELPFVTSDAQMHTLVTSGWQITVINAIGAVLGSHYSFADFNTMLGRAFPPYLKNNLATAQTRLVPFVQTLASLSEADTWQVWTELFNANPVRPKEVVQALAHDDMTAAQIRDFVHQMHVAGIAADAKHAYVSAARGHLNTPALPGHADNLAVTEQTGTKILSGSEIAAHFNETHLPTRDAATHYPTGQQYDSFSLSALWDDCNLNHPGKRSYPNETTQQKARRQKLALGALLRKRPAQSAAIQSMFAFKEGSAPRPFRDAATEDTYLGGAHIVDRHILGGAQMPNRDAVATRALTKVPACDEVASVFTTTGAANSAIAALVNPYMKANWRTVREKLTLGQNPLEAEHSASVNSVIYRKSDPPHATAAAHAPPRALRTEANIDVNPVTAGVAGAAETYLVSAIGTRAVFPALGSCKCARMGRSHDISDHAVSMSQEHSLDISMTELGHFLMYHWSVREDEDAPYRAWAEYCEVSWDHAADYLTHMETVLEAEPEDLPDLIARNAFPRLDLPASTTPKEVRAANVAWLRSCHEKLSSILQEFLTSPRYPLIVFLKDCMQGNDEQGAFEAFTKLHARDKELAARILSELPDTEADVPADFDVLFARWCMRSLLAEDGHPMNRRAQVAWCLEITRRLRVYVARGHVYHYQEPDAG